MPQCLWAGETPSRENEWFALVHSHSCGCMRGPRYEMTDKHDHQSQHNKIWVWHIRRTIFWYYFWQMESNYCHFYFLSVPSGISDNFRCLLSLTSASCWKFTAVLANVFASQIIPPGTYNLLKLCLLMSLVQTSNGNRDPQDCLDILIITSDTLLVDR